MKVTLRKLDGRSIVLRPDGGHCVAGVIVCACGSTHVRGTGINAHSHDTYFADAVCVRCGEPVGKMECRVSTVFGIEEDERMLGSSKRWRVY